MLPIRLLFGQFVFTFPDSRFCAQVDWLIATRRSPKSYPPAAVCDGLSRPTDMNSEAIKHEVANAGHLAPYRNGQELLSAPALPLGLDPLATMTL